MDSLRQVDFVAVNFFSQSAVGGLISSLSQQVDRRWSLTIVDNSCDKAEFAALTTLAGVDGRITCVPASSNLGYLGGARLGLSTLPRSEWTVVCNVDVLFEPDFVRTLLTGGYAGVPAPAIVWRARDQNPFLTHRPSSRQLRRWEWQFRWAPVARFVVLAGGMLASVPSSHGAVTGASIYAGHGSCLVLPVAYFERGGDLQHPAFMYGEEIYVAEQCRRLGLQVTYQPQLRVRHQAHASTGLLRDQRLLRFQRDSIAHIRRMIEPDEN